MRNQIVRRTRVAAAAMMLIMLLPTSLLAQRGAPAGPTNVTVVSNGSTATVSWTPVESRGVLYRVLRAPNDQERGVDLTDPIEGVTFEDGQVELGVTYFYQIVAVLADGTLAAATPVAFTLGKGLRAPPMVAPALPPAPIPAQIVLPPAPIATPQVAPPAAQQTIAQRAPMQVVPSTARTPMIGAAPGNPTVSGSPANATVSWVAADGASGYSVERWSQINPSCCRVTSPLLPATVTSWADSNYPLEGNYVFQVTAHYPNGTQGSVVVSWLRPAPQDPANFTAAYVGGTTVKLTWQPVPGVSKYLVGGLGNTVTVSGTAFSVDKVPAGTRTWTVLSLYEPGGVFTKGVQASVAVGLYGWTDLHTHPMSNLAFGGKLFHGGPDIGSLLPAVQMPYDPQCRFDVRAVNKEEALSDDAPTHGDPLESKCGSFTRKVLIRGPLEGKGIVQPGHAVGAPTFVNWPVWNDITHQKMWWEWIKRAHDGGLRVMVALSHNNRTLADVLGPGNFTPNKPGSPVSGPTDDVSSSDLQIAEIKAFVGRHPNFMKLAFSAADVYNIVQAGRIAVVLGVEIDNIGNFNRRVISPALIEGEIQRLFNQGVRYIFPIHLTDNVFGDTAIYEDLFDLANARETGSFWNVVCADPGDEIGFRAPNINISAPWAQFIPNGVNPPQAAPCMAATVPAPTFLGHKNGRNATGLTLFGRTAIRAMMKLGMIIDVDHMSDRAVNSALQIAEGIPDGGYPLVSGHSGMRDGAEFNAENSRTRAQLQRIGCLQGMFGVGTAGADAYPWAGMYARSFNEMTKPFATNIPCPNKASWFGPGSVALGTDINSLVSTPRPPKVRDMMPGAPPRVSLYGLPGFPTSPSPKFGQQKWDYDRDGVVHYGMYADFIKDVRYGPVIEGMKGDDLVDNHLMLSADYFWRMWQRIEAQKVKVP